MIVTIEVSELTSAYAIFIQKAKDCRWWQYRRRNIYKGMAASISAVLRVYAKINLGTIDI
jgi:hypothetical protein